MKRKLISILLCAAILMTLVPAFSVSAAHSEINYKQIVADMVNYWKGREGTYTTVTNDSGGVSIGILQWHNVRALRLLNRIINMDTTQAYNLLGSSLYYEITNASNNAWNSRSLNSSEKSKISALIGTKNGISAQDSQAYEDISGYVDHGYSLGVRTDPALEYFCDIENAYGSGGCVSVVNKVKTGLGVSLITSLDQFHRGVATYVNAYMSRRTATYNYIKSLGYDTTGKLVTLPGSGNPEPVIDPDDICIGCPGENFTDMPGKTNWAHVGIEYVLVAGLFCGTSATTFEPDADMSRAMLVQVLYNFDKSGNAWGADAPSGTFTDVAAGKWYEKVILWAAGREIVSGSGDGIFNPDGSVTREQIALILYRYAALKGYDVSKSAALTAYGDADKVSDYAEDAMRWAVAEKLISGATVKGVTNLDPQGAASRAQVACIIMRFATEYVPAQ